MSRRIISKSPPKKREWNWSIFESKLFLDRWGQRTNCKAIKHETSFSLAIQEKRPITDMLAVSSTSLAAPPAKSVVSLPQLGIVYGGL